MHWVVRLIVSLLAGFAAALLGFAAVALAFLTLGIDPGIGGGLVALVTGLIADVAVCLWLFGRLARAGEE